MKDNRKVVFQQVTTQSRILNLGQKMHAQIIFTIFSPALNVVPFFFLVIYFKW